MKIGIERLHNCVIFWMDVDVWPVAPCMFHTHAEAVLYQNAKQLSVNVMRKQILRARGDCFGLLYSHWTRSLS